MEYQISCPHCGKTISSDSSIESTDREAGLVSAFVYCECGNKLTFSVIISQLRDQENPEQYSNSDIINLPWLKDQTGLS
jgi:hypothetical protein